jgi:hypothetical protein
VIFRVDLLSIFAHHHTELQTSLLRFGRRAPGPERRVDGLRHEARANGDLGVALDLGADHQELAVEPGDGVADDGERPAWHWSRGVTDA